MTNGKLASFRLIQKTLLDKSTGWFWCLDIPRHDGRSGRSGVSPRYRHGRGLRPRVGAAAGAGAVRGNAVRMRGA
jgi:hypothetical protein